MVFWIFTPENWGKIFTHFWLACIFFKWVGETSNHQQKKLYKLNPPRLGIDWLMSFGWGDFFLAANQDICFLQKTADDVSSGVLAFFKGAYDKISRTLGWRLDIFDVFFDHKQNSIVVWCYCWWFRNPAPVEVGRLHPNLHKVIHPRWLPGGM